MHKTLHNDVLGFIDTNGKDIKGWAFHKTLGVCPLRVNPDTQTLINQIVRPDVSSFYTNVSVLKSGWHIHLEIYGKYDLQMNINGEWATIFHFDWEEVNTISNKSVPTFLVVDNFYSDPYSVRKFALEQQFIHHPKFHKGSRTEQCHRFPGLKERFEELLGYKIKNWEKYGTNGCFQVCIAGDQLVYHTDTQQYAGILFLTPDAPPQTGTQFYRSKITHKMKTTKDEYDNVFRNGFYDSTNFDLVDSVGNVFNRLVLFDAQLIHAATTYFGTNMNNGRLFQLFFFDLESN